MAPVTSIVAVFIFAIVLGIFNCINGQLSILAAGIPHIISLLENVNNTSTEMASVLPDMASSLKHQEDMLNETKSLLENATIMTDTYFLEDQQDKENPIVPSPQVEKDNYTEITDRLDRLEILFVQMGNGQTQMANTQARMAESLDQLANSQTQIANTQTRMAQRLDQLANGQTQMANTQTRMTESLDKMFHALQSQQGWMIFGNYYYFFGKDDAVNYFHAWTACQEMGSNLASIHSRQEQNFIASKTSSKTWIGLSDQHSEGSFYWTDSTTVDWTYWYTNEPNNHGGNEDCVILREDGRWNDEECGNDYHFVCRKDA